MNVLGYTLVPYIKPILGMEIIDRMNRFLLDSTIFLAPVAPY